MVKNNLRFVYGRLFSGFGSFFFRKEGYSSFLLQSSKNFSFSSFLGFNYFLFLVLCFSTSTSIIRLFVSNVYFLRFYDYIFILSSSAIVFFKKMVFFFFLFFIFYFISLYIIQNVFFIHLLVYKGAYNA